MGLTDVSGRNRLGSATRQVQKPAVIRVPGHRGYLLHLDVLPSMRCQRVVVLLVVAASQLELKQTFMFKK